MVGVYTAPSIVPSPNGDVSITATAPQNPNNSSDTQVVTSNTATISVGGGAGLVVSPAGFSIPAGFKMFQFSATLNSLPDMNVTWAVTSTNGGDIGVIDPNNGTYTAPSFPPPGGVITVTAVDHGLSPGATASVTATIVYADPSFKGPFSFSYTGNDNLGFLAVTGSLVANGAGDIVSGVEDVQSFLTGVTTQLQIRGNYTVGPDGRTNVTLNQGLQSASTLQFAITNNNNPSQSVHAFLIRVDANATGGGTIDQQNLNDLTSSDSVISGNYVLSLAGLDTTFKPLGMAGRLFANGAGQFQAIDSILDVNDNGTVTSPPDRTLAGTYSFDPTFPNTGRGTLTLTSTAIGTRTFAFYIVDNTHLRLVEIDGTKSFLAGDMYLGLPGGAFTNSSLAAANYVFTTGGASPTGIYSSGGIFLSDSNGNTPTGGAFDSNNNGTVQTNTTINACTYTTDSTTGRIDLRLNIGAGTCTAGPSATTLEFATYQTAAGSAVMLELDSASVSTGLAFQQAATPTLTTGGFALNLIGQGVLHNAKASIQQVVDGQLTLSGSSVTHGTLDINIFGSVFLDDLLGDVNTTTPSSFAAPASNGRGTAVLAASGPPVTYNLSYYLIDNNTALLFVQNKTIFAIGTIGRQF